MNTPHLGHFRHPTGAILTTSPGGTAPIHNVYLLVLRSYFLPRRTTTKDRQESEQYQLPQQCNNNKASAGVLCLQKLITCQTLRRNETAIVECVEQSG